MKAAVTRPAAVAALVAAEDRENERAAFWALVPMPARVVVMLTARLPRDRAADPLTSFTRAERHHIALALEVMTSHLAVAAQCMRDTAPTHTVLLH
ncbi:hypothetical protein [Pseudoduganella sp. UC29_71]|uniref:hypothetical protein n=1 Tax=Pseudoduganella sp. UC29_71 TaxID=3350174 RepID=UPI00366E94DF